MRQEHRDNGSAPQAEDTGTSPGRQGFRLQLALSYDTDADNGPFGLDWRLSLPDISHKPDKGLPRYRDAVESDTFVLSGAEGLVPWFLREVSVCAT
jgi:hypothetical protein